jgi:hypothetical protein
MTRTLRSNWLDLVLAALVAIAEGAMVAPWLHFISGELHHGASNVPSPIMLTLAGLILYWCARYFLTGGWDISAARALSLASWLVLMIIWYGVASGHPLSAPWHFIDRLVRADTALIFLLIAGAVAWWRALMLASNPTAFTPEFARKLIWRAVFVAGVALVLALLAGGETGHAVSDSAILAFPLLLLASLLAAAAAQAKAARAAIHSGADPARVGLSTASGITFGLILVAVGVAGLAGRHFWSQLAEPLRWLQSGFETLIYVILVGIAYAIFFILWPLIWALQHLQGKPPPQQQQQQNGAGKVKDQLQNVSNPLPHGITVAIEVLLLAALVSFLVWLILRSLRRYLATQAEAGVDEVHESVWSSDLALQQLRSLFNGLGRRRGEQSARPFDLDAEPVDVRDAYRHLLALGEREGYARRANESASDYLARLRLAWTASGEPLDDLTLRYLSARYAEQDSDDDLTHARRDWHQLRQRFARS